MNTDPITTEDQVLAAALQNVPAEVEDFMWSDAFTIIIDAVQETLGLTEDQKKRVRIASYDILTGLKTMEDISKDFSVDTPPELVAKILYAIDSEIITRAENITEFYTENPDESEQSIQSAPSPADVLARLNQTLTKPATIAPVKREYSAPTTAPSEPITKPSVDPYREIPEK